MTDAEFVEAMTDLTGNLYQCAKRIEAVRGGSTAPSVCLSPAEFDRLVALARCGLRLAKDVSDGMDCLPSCNADAHDEICPFAHPEVAWRTLRQQLAGAARLADEVAALVRRGVLDARCPAADALLDYREPPATPRADRLASLDIQLADAEARVDALTLQLNSAGADQMLGMHAVQSAGGGVMADPRLCSTCRLGPAFRLDLVLVRGRRYRCPDCGAAWRLVTVCFRSRHERVGPAGTYRPCALPEFLREAPRG